MGNKNQFCTRVRCITAILAIVVTFFFLNRFLEKRNSKKFRERIESLEKERDSLNKEKETYFIKVDSLQLIVDKKFNEVDSLSKEMDSIKKIRHEIPNNVNSLPVSKLDSILANYRHPRGN